MQRWWIAEAGLFLTVFALVALSGPGRIDIVDGQTRYEVARSLVEHGDLVIRDPDVWFGVFPGRAGQLYTKYRFPQSAAAVIAIIVADMTGPVSEARRHFFFSLTSAVAAAILATTYARLFRSLGYELRLALLWAAAGILCTPSWFYGTSMFDDILGSAAVVMALSIALVGRHRHVKLRAVTSGLALGLAFNCKEPLGIFVLPVLAAIYDPNLNWRLQWDRWVLIAASLAVGLVVYKGFNLYKFPPGSTASHTEISKRYGPVWAVDPIVALLVMSFSLSAGVPFYNPAISVCFSGFKRWWRFETFFCLALATAMTIFILFISFLTFFKGDPAWGPRYLTPIFAVLWIFAPAGSQLLRRWVLIAILGLSSLVQLGALCIDPHRLYVERSLPSTFYLASPELYFHPAISHIINRPREIREVIANQSHQAERYSPAPLPTFAFPVIDFVEKGPTALQKYRVLSSFRFWWASFCYLKPSSRPTNLGYTISFLLGTGTTGLGLLIIGVSRS
jgi:hypothetical protein